MTHAYRFVRRLATCGMAVTLAVPSIVAAQSDYRVLATRKTSTMQREMQEAGEAGYRFVCVMGGETSFGGKEVAVILERDREAEPGQKFEYLLLATKRTSTMQKEIKEAADRGYQVVGMAVGATMFGGSELVTITRRPRS